MPTAPLGLPGPTDGPKMARGRPRGRVSRLGHETVCRVTLRLLGRLLRDPVQYRSARVRHDPCAGVVGAGRSAHLLFWREGLGNLRCLRIAGHSRLLSGRLGAGAAVPQRAADGLEEGLAAAPPVSVLRAASRHPWFRSPSSIFRRSPPARPAPQPCATRSTLRGSPTRSASLATGSPSTIICPRSPAPRPTS